MPRALRVASRDVWWRFLEKGTGDEVVLYLHGWMSGSGAWQPIMQRMNGPYRLLAPDLPGFGGTSPGRRFDYSVPAYAAAVVDLLRTLAVNRTTVVGWSFGGAVAMWMAAQEPHRVTRLVLINSAGGSPDMQLAHRISGHHVLGAALWRLPRLVWDYIIRWAASGSGRSLAHMPGWFVDYQRRIVTGRWSRRAAYGVMRSLTRLRREGRQALIQSVVRRIHQPTLILWGERDRGMPVEHGLRLQRSIAHARLVVLSGCAHCPPVEAPDAVVEALEPFVMEPIGADEPDTSWPATSVSTTRSSSSSSSSSSSTPTGQPVPAWQDG